MSRSLEQLLASTAVTPVERVDPDRLIAAGARRRTRRRVGTAVSSVAAVVVAVAVVRTMLVMPVPPRIVDDQVRPSPTAAGPAGVSDPVGPELSLEELAQLATPMLAFTLPGEETWQATLVLVGLDGTVYGHVPRGDFFNSGGNAGVLLVPGPALVVQDDRQATVPGGTPVPETYDAVLPLIDGYEIRFRWGYDPGAHQLFRDGQDVGYFTNDLGPWALGSGRDVLSQHDSDLASAGFHAYDLTLGEQISLPDGCLALDRHPDQGLLLACATPGQNTGSDPSSRLAWADGTVVATAPEGPVDPTAGTYQRAMLSPAGRPLPGAIVGWSDDGRAIVVVDTHPAGAGTPPPGLHLLDPVTGATELLWTGPDILAAQLVMPSGGSINWTASGCAAGPTVLADVDGDGDPDQIVHVYEDGGAVLRVCLNDGTVGELPGLGQGEVLEVIDLAGDGRALIIYGGTTANGKGGQIALWQDGDLAPLLRPDGEPFEMWHGGLGTFDESAGWSQFDFWGCTAADSDGQIDLLTAKGVRTDAGYTFEVTNYAIQGQTIRPIATNQVDLSDDPYADAETYRCPLAAGGS